MAVKKKPLKKKPSRKSAARKTPVRKARKVDPIPKGMHTLTPMLTFKSAGAALAFYKDAFGGKELYRLCEPNGKIGHAEMMIGNSLIMLAEEYPDMALFAADHYGGIPMRLNLVVKDVDRTFECAVRAGAQATRPVKDQFYGWRSGNIKDPFGYHWMISTQIEDISPKEMQKRWNKMFEQQAD
ncbi:MAG: VOC family protein [Rhodospirillaceae bacterium]